MKDEILKLVRERGIARTSTIAEELSGIRQRNGASNLCREVRRNLLELLAEGKVVRDKSTGIVFWKPTKSSAE